MSGKTYIVAWSDEIRRKQDRNSVIYSRSRQEKTSAMTTSVIMPRNGSRNLRIRTAKMTSTGSGRGRSTGEKER